MHLSYFILSFTVLTAVSLHAEGSSIRIPLRQKTVIDHAKLKKRQSDTDSLVNYYNNIFVGNVQIGGQQFVLHFDTGSDLTWVPSKKCLTSTCSSYSRYDSQLSTTYKPTNLTDEITYEEGSSVKLIVSIDTVTIGNFSVQNQAFGEAIVMSSNFGSQYDGLMGLGQFTEGGMVQVTDPNGQPQVTKTIVQNMYDQKLIQKNQFSFYLASLAPGEVQDQQGGEIIFGDIIPSLYTGEIMYEPLYLPSSLLAPLYWQIGLQEMLLPNVAGILSINGLQAAYIDSGTSYMVAPPEQADSFHSQMGAVWNDKLQRYLVYCSNTLNYAPLNITFSTYSFQLPTSQWIDNTIDSSGQYCATKIQRGPPNPPNQWVIGDVFMRQFYTIFDVQNKQIGFAQLVSRPSSVPSDNFASNLNTSSSNTVHSDTQGNVAELSEPGNDHLTGNDHNYSSESEEPSYQDYDYDRQYFPDQYEYEYEYW